MMEEKNLQNAEVLNESTEKINAENTEKETKELTAAEKLQKRIAEMKGETWIQESPKEEKKPVNEKSKDEKQVEQVKENTIKEELETPKVEKEVKKEKSEKKEIEEPIEDFTTQTREKIVERFNELIETEPVQNIKKRAENIKSTFYKKLKDEVEQTKNEFLKDGGIIDDFKMIDDKLEETFKLLVKKYKEKKADYTSKVDKEKQENLKKKYQIVEDLKNLINKPEAFNETFNEFKELQKEWREIGLVPADAVKKLWEDYNYQVESFYNYLEINKELRDLDLKKNLTEKIELCEKAEELVIAPAIVKAYKELQTLHDKWRETGPVIPEKKEEVWERFKAATIQINKKHQEHFEELKKNQEQNLSNKIVLCEKVEELGAEETNNHKDWKFKSEIIIEIQKLWKGIGYAPKKENDEVYTRFRAACDKFFTKKREFYAVEHEERENNLQLKTELCIQAENLQNSTDWRKTTDIYKKLQADWKKIGQVPRKVSDDLWKRFRGACNTFFESKQNFYKSRRTEEDNNLVEKNKIIEQITNFEFTDRGAEDLNKLKELQTAWTNIGHVPFEQKDEIYHKYRDAVNLQFKELNIDSKQREQLNFKEKIAGIKGSRRSKELFNDEIEKIRTKVDKINADITLWENNLGFFANTKNAESMIKDFKGKIEESKEKVKGLLKQISLLRKEESNE